MTTAPHDAMTTPQWLLAEWTGMLGAPVVWTLQFGVVYGLATVSGDALGRAPHHLACAAGLAGTVGAGFLSLRNWRVAQAKLREFEHDPHAERARLMSVLGMMSGLLFALVTLAQWIAVFTLNAVAL